MEVFFLQHGEKSDDGNLTIQGMTQANKTGDYLKQYNNTKFDYIVHSPSNYCLQTAKLVADRLSYTGTINVDNNLTEIYSIPCIDDLNNDPIKHFKSLQTLENKTNEKYKKEGKEVTRLIKKRINHFIRSLKYKKVLIVTSLSIITALSNQLLDLPFYFNSGPYYGDNPTGNCSLTYWKKKGKYICLMMPTTTSHLKISQT